MQQLQELRDLPRRLSERRDWFQLGMASAAVMTPLVSRWRSLRAAERARALWAASQAGGRWPWVHPAGEDVLPPLARRDVRAGLWLAGVGVGLAAAGTAAFVIARRRMRIEEEPLELPLITRADTNGNLDLGGDTSPLRPDAPAGIPGAVSGDTHLVPTGKPAEARAAEQPPVPLFIGNTQTLLYTPADSGVSPPEDVRIYFASEAQARQAGYRAAPDNAAR